jgi:hypothetical protein
VAGSSTDTLTVNDQGNEVDTGYFISDTSILRDGVASITLFGNFDQVVVYGGGGTNTFDVTPSASTTFTADGGAAGTSTLIYHTGGSTTYVDDGSSITDPEAGVQPLFYSNFAEIRFEF